MKNVFVINTNTNTLLWVILLKQSRLESTTAIRQNKYVKVLHYFVDDIKLLK
jgi:hypothetical protein